MSRGFKYKFVDVLHRIMTVAVLRFTASQNRALAICYSSLTHVGDSSRYYLFLQKVFCKRSSTTVLSTIIIKCFYSSKNEFIYYVGRRNVECVLFCLQEGGCRLHLLHW